MDYLLMDYLLMDYLLMDCCRFLPGGYAESETEKGCQADS